MVAPQPAVIRHGDASQLGMLAFLAGQARRQRSTPQFVQQPSRQQQAFDQATAAPERQAQPARVVYGGQPGLQAAVESGRVVVNPQARRAELEALKQRQAQRRAQTPTDSRARTRQSPLVQDLQGRDRTGFGAISGEGGVQAVTETGDRIEAVSPEAAGQIAGAAGVDSQLGEALTGLGEGQATGGGFTQGTPAGQGLSSQAQTKLAYAQLSGLGQLPEQSQRAIQQIIMDDNVDVQQARLMMDRVAERQGGGDATGLSPRQAAQMQVHELRREEQRLRDQAEEIGQSYSVEERNMTLEEFSQMQRDRLGRGVSIIPFYTGAPSEETVEEEIEQFRRFKELEQEAETLQQERRRRIGLEDGGDAQELPTGNGEFLTREQAQLFMRAAGGDKEQAREMARNRGFRF